MYGLIGNLKAKEGKGEALAEILLQAAEILQNENGCHQYLISQQKDEAEVIWVTEIWTSKEAHDASLQIAGIEKLIKKAMPLLADSPRMGIETIPLGGVGKYPVIIPK